MRRQLTYANVASTLAIFLVLAGGTAFAVGLRKNSVTSATVLNNSLKSIDLADRRGVTGADVRDGSLVGPDLAPGSVTGADIANGSIAGADLEAGSVGAAALGVGAIQASKLDAKAVGASNVIDGSIQAADVEAQTVTGRNIDESTLGPVNSAFALGGLPTTAFMRSQLSVTQTNPSTTGISVGDGTFKLTQGCEFAGETLLAGGAVDLNPGSVVIESFPKENTWTVRINPQGASDPFAVQVVCTGRAL